MVNILNNEIAFTFKNKNNKYFIKLLKYLSYLIGIFVTMPIVTLHYNGKHLSVFTFLYVMMMFMLIVTLKSFTINIKKKSIILYFWLLFSMVSSIFGLLFFVTEKEWSNVVLRYIPKIYSFFIFLFLLYNSKYKKIIIEFFFNGLIMGCIFNLIWVTIEGFIFYVYYISLNNIVFADYIKLLPENRKFISITYAGGIRATGFNYDPAHLGGLIPIVFTYFYLNKNYIMFPLIITALAFSQSTTALLSTVLIIIIHFKKGVFLKKKIRFSFNKALIGGVILICLFLLLVVIFNKYNIVTSLLKNIDGFTNRVSTVYIKNDEPNIRTLYHKYIPDAMIFNGFATIIGTGFGTASYPYINEINIKNNLNITFTKPYDPESTYISYLFDLGIVGLLIYLYILFIIYRYYNKNYNNKYNLIILSTITSIILSSIFYHYTLTAYHVLSIIMAMLYMDIQVKKRRYSE